MIKMKYLRVLHKKFRENLPRTMTGWLEAHPYRHPTIHGKKRHADCDSQIRYQICGSEASICRYVQSNKLIPVATRKEQFYNKFQYNFLDKKSMGCQYDITSTIKVPPSYVRGSVCSA